MADDNPMDRDAADAISPAKQDEMVERAVLAQVLFLHPDRLTILELSLQVEGGGESFMKKDAVERAVRELSRDGLLVCDCRRIWPTRAALRFEKLLGGVL